MSEEKIRAYHAPSGGILVGVVTETMFEKAGQVSYRIIPDGLLESVIIREGVWQVTRL